MAGSATGSNDRYSHSWQVNPELIRATQLGMEPPDMSGWQYMEEIGELQEFGAEAEGAS
jgi:hypothetical protein